MVLNTTNTVTLNLPIELPHRPQAVLRWFAIPLPLSFVLLKKRGGVIRSFSFRTKLEGQQPVPGILEQSGYQGRYCLSFTVYWPTASFFVFVSLLCTPTIFMGNSVFSVPFSHILGGKQKQDGRGEKCYGSSVHEILWQGSPWGNKVRDKLLLSCSNLTCKEHIIPQRSNIG